MKQFWKSAPLLITPYWRGQHNLYSLRLNAESAKAGTRARGDVVLGHKLDLVPCNGRSRQDLSGKSQHLPQTEGIGVRTRRIAR